MMERGRKRVGKSDFERKAEQLRSQLETMQESFDDITKNYTNLRSMGADWLAQAQKPIASTIRQVREKVEDAPDGIMGTGIRWWIPVAVVGIIGAGVWVYNTFFAPVAEQMPNNFSTYASGNQSSFVTPESTFTEGR